MGYVKVSKINQFLPPALFGKAGGTWTLGVSSNVVAETRSTADSSFALYLPILAPSSEAYRQGARLESVTVYYKIAGAAADDFSAPVLHKMALPVASEAASGAALSLTLDGGHDSADERKAVGTHSMTISLESPCWLGEDECVWLQLSVDAAASTSFSLYGAQVNYDLNL